MNTILKIGTRSSNLALTQTGNALKKLAGIFPSFEFKSTPFSSPGDRDRKTDLKLSDQDFFTRDLDDAVINGEIDAAVHSAKDLPNIINPKLDWFWLPWQEDPRDVLVVEIDKVQGIRDKESGKSNQSISEKKCDFGNTITKLKIGVSSERREEYCRQRFPEAELLPIRGNIEDRIAQLDAGKYNLLIMAAAGLKRLGLEERISEYIPLTEMPPPAGQGYLAVTFKKGDRRFEIMRTLFVKPVVFAGAGPGNPELATVACINALKNCEICLYDSLAPIELLKNLAANAEAVYVGKRSGKHSKKQAEICKLITEYARHGKAIVRLKGGDTGIFGRLAEEVEVLDQLSLPYRVFPGISSLQSASGGTGLLLTRRGISRGFSIMTPRKGSSAEYQAVSQKEYLKFPRVYFMGKSVIAQITADLISEGWNQKEAATVIFSAGTHDEFIITGTIANIAEKVLNQKDNEQPGLLMVGKTTDKKFLYHHNGAMAQRKILVTCSEALQEKAACKIRRFCGQPIAIPMIKLTPASSFACPEFVERAGHDFWGSFDREDIATGGGCTRQEKQPGAVALQRKCNWGRLHYKDFDYLLLTSPAAVQIFLHTSDIDLRVLPKIMVCGPGTACEFRKVGIIPDLIAEDDFGASGLIKTAEKQLPAGTKILRLCSDKASKKLSCELRKLGFEVENEILYHNSQQQYDFLPEFDAAIFASSSAVNAFIDNFGKESLKEKTIAVIGQPTMETLKKNSSDCKIIVAGEATIAGTVHALAKYYVNKKLEKN
jgi:uroporphyrinogen III methyltransferase / synthase